MKIDVIISADDIKKEKLQNKTVIVIDMLRATSVIITAVAEGCKEVIPVLTIEEALDLSRENREAFILGGERNALKIESFDCSNSPLEFIKDRVEGKTVVMTTTNGTRAIHGSEGAGRILVGAVINGEAVAEAAVKVGEDVVIVNAGTYGQFSIDDFICSGYIIDCIEKRMKVELTDIATTAHYIYENNTEIFGFIEKAKHYKRIKELGLEEDLQYCTRKSILQVVPEYIDGKIIEMRTE